jgi:hypothetical protein
VIENYRVAGLVLALVGFLVGSLTSRKGLTFVYRITSKDGQCLRVGIAQLHRGGLMKRMKTYRTGQDRSQRPYGGWSYPWQKQVRWWVPPVPYRLARLLRRRGVSHTGVHVGWWPGLVTLEVRATRSRAKRRETAQILLVQPRYNHQENPLHRSRRLSKVA